MRYPTNQAHAGFEPQRPEIFWPFTPEMKKRKVEAVVRQLVLSSEAGQQARHRSPRLHCEVVRWTLRDEVGEGRERSELTVEELRAWYDAHREEFERRVRVLATRAWNREHLYEPFLAELRRMATIEIDGSAADSLDHLPMTTGSSCEVCSLGWF